jgi:hypothetical protein
MLLQPTDDRLSERFTLGSQLSARECGERLHVRLALEKPLQDLPRSSGRARR